MISVLVNYRKLLNSDFFYYILKVSYFNQGTPGITPYFVENLAGSSKSIEDMASLCIQFLELRSNKSYST